MLVTWRYPDKVVRVAQIEFREDRSALNLLQKLVNPRLLA
jgi:hypothetical protein